MWTAEVLFPECQTDTVLIFSKHCEERKMHLNFMMVLWFHVRNIVTFYKDSVIKVFIIIKKWKVTF